MWRCSSDKRQQRKNAEVTWYHMNLCHRYLHHPSFHSATIDRRLYWTTLGGVRLWGNTFYRQKWRRRLVLLSFEKLGSLRHAMDGREGSCSVLQCHFRFGMLIPLGFARTYHHHVSWPSGLGQSLKAQSACGMSGWNPSHTPSSSSFFFHFPPRPEPRHFDSLES